MEKSVMLSKVFSLAVPAVFGFFISNTPHAFAAPVDPVDQYARVTADFIAYIKSCQLVFITVDHSYPKDVSDHIEEVRQAAKRFSDKLEEIKFEPARKKELDDRFKYYMQTFVFSLNDAKLIRWCHEKRDVILNDIAQATSVIFRAE